MLSKIQRLSGLLLVTAIFFMASSYANASNSSKKVETPVPASNSSTENPGTIKTIAQKIKSAVIDGNNKVNIAIAKFSKIVKQAVAVATNKNKEPDLSNPTAEPKKSKLVNIVPKNFIKKVNTVQSVASRLKASIASGDYNLMASIVRNTDAELLGQAISVAINDNPLSSVPIAKSVYDNLSNQAQAPTIVNNMARQLTDSNHHDVAAQVNQIAAPSSSAASSNQASVSSGFALAVNQSPLPTIGMAMENPSIASPNFRP